MNESYDVIIIGGGQAGLSTSYYLTKQAIKHVVLERDDVIASSWQHRKWDSFTLVTPNSMNQLPDFPYPKYGEHEFLNKQEVCQYVLDFAASFNAPVKLNVEVKNVSKNGDGLFEVTTNNGVFVAKQVVVTTGCFNHPNIPAIAQDISPSVLQLHTSNYKNAQDLPEGGVLVVGTAQSGAQITDELVNEGRNVFCATSKVQKSPRHYRGKDITKWARLFGLLEKRLPPFSEFGGKFPSSPQVSGKNGGCEIHLQELMRKGLVLLGRFNGVNDDMLTFADNLAENMQFTHESCMGWMEKVDQYISENNLDAPAPDYVEPAHENYDNAPTSLSIKDNNINTIIWATGYRFDYSWIAEDVFDEYGYPDAPSGISNCDGLSFVGLQFLDANKSTLLYGVGAHAKSIAEHVAKTLTEQTPAEEMAV